MFVSSIISEYNPFHNGHLYHILKTRESGATHIVAIMGGNFLQRGTPAIASKWARAKMALMCGVDLVIELPVLWATATAQKFAFGAVSIADAIGCVDSLSFGSEVGDINKLMLVTKAIGSNKIEQLLKENLSKGMSFASARQNAVFSEFGEDISSLLSSPNNTLAIEYLRALDKLDSKIRPFTIKRAGAGHDTNHIELGTASASFIRKALPNGSIDLLEVMPKDAINILNEEIEKGYAPTNISLVERAILAKLRVMTKSEIKELYDVSEGLENRIHDSIRKSNSLDELYDMVKTKRYTHARIRRIVLSAFLGINKYERDYDVPYIRVLGFNNKGRDILRKARETARLPIIMKYSDISLNNQKEKRTFDLECRASDLYALCSRNIRNCGLDMLSNQVII